jgi:hypothetical protein
MRAGRTDDFSDRPRSYEQSIYRQTADERGVSRTDAAQPVEESGGYEEATVDHGTRPSRFAPRALRRHVRDRSRLMFPLAVAIPLAFLPIVSLSAALRWMAVSSGRSV